MYDVCLYAIYKQEFSKAIAQYTFSAHAIESNMYRYQIGQTSIWFNVRFDWPILDSQSICILVVDYQIIERH